MYKVEIQKQCGCVTRNGLNVMQSFKTKEEAQKEADRLVKFMNSDFCGKHTFAVVESAGNFKIVED